jgi:DNA-binding NarL/FixJ family response regulator
MRTSLLLVDDDEAFRAAARAVLDSAGFDVTAESATGMGALSLAAAAPSTVMLLDVQLPDIDGFEVVRRLRAASASPTVVLISTREAADYGRRIVDSGAAGFITKARLSGASLRAILHADGRVPT